MCLMDRYITTVEIRLLVEVTIARAIICKIQCSWLGTNLTNGLDMGEF